jgi:acetylornithine deacetylase
VTAARGAVWFRATCSGSPVHSGNAGQSASALKSAIALTRALEAYHDRLLAASRGLPPFDVFEDPTPLVFGRLCTGTWPATVPGKAVLEGVLGFLPNKTKEQVMAEVRAAIRQSGEVRLGEDCCLEFTFRHDPYLTPPDAPIVAIMQAAMAGCGGNAAPAAMSASSDAWFYNNQLRIPTITFGAGKLADAHTGHERIALADIERESDMLAAFIRAYTTP